MKYKGIEYRTDVESRRKNVDFHSGLYIRSVNKEKWGKGRIGEMAQTFPPVRLD
ncbi:MAG: hypothetical protein AB1414_15860 [bacterium]